MAISYDYRNVDIDNKFQAKLRSALDFTFNENKKFQQLDGVRTLADWYKEAKEYKQERERDGDNRHAILSSIANKTIDEIVKNVEPCYTESIIKSIGINTHFKSGANKMNCNIEFISLKPFVKFVKRVDGDDNSCVIFKFQLDSSMYINGIQIHDEKEVKSLGIDKLGIELKLTLLHVIIESPVSIISFDKPTKLVSKKFEVDNLLFHLKRPATNSTKFGALNLSSTANIGAKSNISITCQKCGNISQGSFKFCNTCLKQESQRN
jgi:hypothetical protein